MMTDSLYNFHITPTGFSCAKFDADLNLEAAYDLIAIDSDIGAYSSLPSRYACNCPAGPRPSCKHRKMLSIFIAAEAVNSSRFYDYERQTWHTPLAAYGEPKAPKEELERVEGTITGRMVPSEPNFEEVEAALVGEALGSPVPVIAQPQPVVIRRRI
jgi:hypothetical protein